MRVAREWTVCLAYSNYSYFRIGPKEHALIFLGGQVSNETQSNFVLPKLPLLNFVSLSVVQCDHWKLQIVLSDSLIFISEEDIYTQRLHLLTFQNPWYLYDRSWMHYQTLTQAKEAREQKKLEEEEEEIRQFAGAKKVWYVLYGRYDMFYMEGNDVLDSSRSSCFHAK